LGATGVMAGVGGAGVSGGTSLALTVGSVILIGHGIDNTWAGICTAITGGCTQTITSSAVEVATGSHLAGELVDAFVGIAGSIGVGMGIKSAQTAGQAATTASKTNLGKAANELGATREAKVAEMLEGHVPGSGKIKPGSGSTNIDVIAKNGDLVGVGGGAKNRNLSKLGTELKVLMEEANKRGVKVHYALPEGTNPALVEFIKKRINGDIIFFY